MINVGTKIYKSKQTIKTKFFPPVSSTPPSFLSTSSFTHSSSLFPKISQNFDVISLNFRISPQNASFYTPKTHQTLPNIIPTLKLALNQQKPTKNLNFAQISRNFHTLTSKTTSNNHLNHFSILNKFNQTKSFFSRSSFLLFQSRFYSTQKNENLNNNLNENLNKENNNKENKINEINNENLNENLNKENDKIDYQNYYNNLNNYLNKNKKTENNNLNENNEINENKNNKNNENNENKYSKDEELFFNIIGVIILLLISFLIIYIIQCYIDLTFVGAFAVVFFVFAFFIPLNFLLYFIIGTILFMGIYLIYREQTFDIKSTFASSYSPPPNK